jgi:hypothetical protein
MFEEEAPEHLMNIKIAMPHMVSLSIYLPPPLLSFLSDLPSLWLIGIELFPLGTECLPV